MAGTRGTLEDRFQAKVDRRNDDDCWRWLGCKTPTGYGQIRRRTGVMTYAHIVAFELTQGPVPEGMEVDHLCFQRDCVNPAHLEAVSRRENHRRRAGRPRRTILESTCKRGHDREVWGFKNSAGATSCRLCHREAAARHRETRKVG